MRLLRGTLNWGRCPQTPGIYRFFLARMAVFDYFQGTGATCPQPFRPLSRSLGSLPSVALSRPAQVLPGWTTSTSPYNSFSSNGDYPLTFVSHSRGSLHIPSWPLYSPDRGAKRSAKTRMRHQSPCTRSKRSIDQYSEASFGLHGAVRGRVEMSGARFGFANISY